MNVAAEYSKAEDAIQAYIDSLESDKANAQSTIDNLMQAAQQDGIAMSRLQDTIDSLRVQVSANATTIAELKAQIAASQKVQLIGFNGHTFNSPIYSDIDNSLDKLVAAGGNAYRVNFNVTDAGVAQYEDKLAELRAKCAARGIKLQLCVNIDYGDVLRGLPGGTTIGKGLSKYAFDWLEIGNEWSIKDWKKDGTVRMIKTGDGTKVTDYDQTLMSQCGAVLKGVYDALRAGSPDTKLIINGQWLNTAWNDYVINTLGLKFDILAWHWYSEQVIARKDHPTIESILQKLFPGMPILWNEVGARPDSKTGKFQQAQIDALVKFVGSEIKGRDIILYALFDQPELTTNKQEASYGFYDASGNAKPILAQVKSVL
jgi:hypothetical protein